MKKKIGIKFLSKKKIYFFFWGEVVHIPRENLPSPTPSPTSLAFTDSPFQTRAFPSSIQPKNNTSDDDLEANWGGDLE